MNESEVKGANLRQLLTDRSISERDALEFVPQIAEALQHAHEAGCPSDTTGWYRQQDAFGRGGWGLVFETRADHNSQAARRRGLANVSPQLVLGWIDKRVGRARCCRPWSQPAGRSDTRRSDLLKNDTTVPPLTIPRK